ncbi:hypothetical protein [Reyranella sp. CPCC 100927]|uniref:hypothetical protein n=1 Tax=Reyranella sp. CPCC 100927 TaxID=2599616 RepID=UPI0011B3C96C|nr:hypothetical protein [Reyranella sp. CPCC 100927]TWT04085.1 hypothetical protein FQU96_27265 [Reyranella sp. CPCC 100927]
MTHRMTSPRSLKRGAQRPRPIILVVTGLCWATSAMAHDEHDWIRQRGYKDIEGQACCDPTDCKRVPVALVEELPGGDFRYVPTGETIPRAETRPSPDGNFWRCHWYEQGKERTRRLCFWRPLPPS